MTELAYVNNDLFQELSENDLMLVDGGGIWGLLTFVIGTIGMINTISYGVGYALGYTFG